MLRVPNAALHWVIGGTVAFLALALSVPVAQALFHFGPIHARDLALSLGAGVMCIVWFDLLKLTKWWVRFGHGVR
jgi:Ca2+-transporting ATPase